MTAKLPDKEQNNTYRGRLLVPVLGTGFNRWLLQGTDAPPALTDWWALLRTVAWRSGLVLDERLDRILDGRGDATFAWEALLAAGVQHGIKETTGEREKRLLNVAADIIKRAENTADTEASRGRWRDFCTAVWGASEARGDLLSLNFSIPACGNMTAEHPWRPANQSCSSASDSSPDDSKTSTVSIPATVRQIHPDLRVWFPHGHVSDPITMILGVHRYVRSAAYVERSWRAFKAMERNHTSNAPIVPRFHHRLRAQPTDKLSWLAVAINAPLLLLGVGLHRSEVDLWEFLHLRARNHANLSDADRPPIWRFTSDEERPEDRAPWDSLQRSASGALNIRELNLGRTWNEAWSNLLTLLPPDSKTPFGD